jgi:L-2-amino-thiazoline-4-carboxylic acid hydrolase
MTEMARAPIPMFEQRRIEAMILKHVYDTLKASHGIEVAQRTIADAVRASSIEQAKEFAAKVGGKTSIQTFVDRQSLWKLGGAMKMDVKEQTEVCVQRDPLQVCGDVPRHGPRRDRASAVVPARCHVLRGVRQAHAPKADANDHAGCQPLRLPLHVGR